MSEILSICLFELKRTFIKPSAYVLMLAMPLLFALLFGSVFGNDSDKTINFTIVDKDQTNLSTALIQQLESKNIFAITKTTSIKAEKLLKDHDTEGVFTINKGYETNIVKQNNPKITFKHQPNTSNSPLLKQMVDQSVAKMKLHIVSAQTWSRQSGEDWKTMYNKLANDHKSKHMLTTIENGKSTNNKILSGTSYSSAGFSIMFVMIMMLSVTGTIIEARKSGVWSRLFTSPATKFQIMSGYFLAFFLIGWIQFMLLMISSSLLFDVRWGNPLGVLVLISSLLLCVVGLGLAIASIVKTTEQQSAIGTLIIISTCMLGGVYWPLSIVPDFMQKIANFVPQSWAMKGFNELIAGRGTVVDILTPVVVLLGFSLVFLSIGLSRIRYE